MQRNSSASMYGGYPMGGRRAPVTSLGGLRSALRNETQADSAPAAVAAPTTRTEAPAPVANPAVPQDDDKQTLKGLNSRLLGYLNTVKQLQKDNGDLQREIDDILAKRKAPKGRDWDEVQKALEDLRQKIKDLTMDNAKLMVDADNAKMANDDFNNKLNDEINARKVLEKDLEDVKKAMENTRMDQENTRRETDIVKDEIDRIQKEHKDMVDILCEKIRTSKVTVEIEPDSNNLTSTLSNMRVQYEKIAERNLKETDDWYKNKFENIKVVEAQNTEALESGNKDLNDKRKEIQKLELSIQGVLGKIKSLEEILQQTKVECGNRLGSINRVVQNRETELMRVRSQVEQQMERNRDLVGVKMRLEEEIRTYQTLINKASNDESSEISLADAVNSEPVKPNNDDVKQPEE